MSGYAPGLGRRNRASRPDDAVRDSAPRAFAPALGRRRRDESEDYEAFGPAQVKFAPALTRGRRTADDDADEFNATPRYATANLTQTNSWQAFVPGTNAVIGQQVHRDRNEDDVVLQIEREVQWDRDEDLLSNRPTDTFEASNASILGFGVNLNNIRTAHGAVRISTDNRATIRNADGTYKDGIDRGSPKARHVQEFKRRYQEREKEKAAWQKKIDKWNSLTESQREARRQLTRDNLRILMDSFQMKQVEETPEDYEGESFEMSDMREALMDQEDSETGSSTPIPDMYNNSYGSPRSGSFASSSRSGPGTSGRAGCYAGSNTSRSRQQSRNAFNRNQSPAVSHHSDRSHPTSQSTLHSSYAHEDKSISRRGQQSFHQSNVASSHSHSSPELSTPGNSSLATPTTMSFPFRPRVRLSEFKNPPTMTPIQAATVEWSKFEVKTHPDYTVIEDVAPRTSEHHTDAQETKIARVMDLSGRKGRLVTVRLPKEVTMSFPEAICDRLFGGMMQEVQFFPDSHHAVICFLTPVAAAAFVRHIYNTRNNSQHEYLRLQLAATWYEDNEHSAVFPAQENIVRAVVYENASRVIEISGIEKGLLLGDVTSSVKNDIGLARLVVKGRLIVPTKLYEKAKKDSSRMILEMASIRDAVDVKDMINTTGLRDFPHAKATFTKDPVDSPLVEKEFCDCKYCTLQRKVAAS